MNISRVFDYEWRANNNNKKDFLDKKYAHMNTHTLTRTYTTEDNVVQRNNRKIR